MNQLLEVFRSHINKPMSDIAPPLTKWSAILDDIIGMTVAALGLPNLYVSINLNIDFLSPARTGERVIAKSFITRAGKTIVNATAEIYNEKEQLLSRATSNLANTGLPSAM
ncbi:MAG: PaaI family thioesterase [Thermoflexibacter sp.]|nr:PaaI family thioesterase [Thermoflexibacter sp.]